MKFFIMLTVILSSFFMFSCGGSDSSSGGMSESDFYNGVAIQTCEKGFKCDIDYLKGGKKDISECQKETSSQTCPHDFDGVKAQECHDCMETISCEDYKSDAGAKACPMCSQVCVYKP